MTLTNCGICNHEHDSMRDHCPVCGARRVFIASHSFEPYRVIVRARDAHNLSREIVRAYRSDLAFNFITAC